MTHPSQPGLGERKCAELRAVEVDGVDASQRIDVVSDEYEKLTGRKAATIARVIQRPPVRCRWPLHAAPSKASREPKATFLMKWVSNSTS